MMKECPSFPGYSVSENLEIISHRKRRPIKGGGVEVIIDKSKIKIMKMITGAKGYLYVSIPCNGKIRPIGVHVLIADAFHGPKSNRQVVRHLDDNKLNNHPDNLAYGDNRDNVNDRIINGGYVNGEAHVNAKLTNEQAAEIRKLRVQKVRVKELARTYAVSISTIESIIYNKSYLRCERPENFLS